MGRTALITGGSSGIGRSCALRLARDGLSVGVLGRRDQCMKVAAEIQDAGGKAVGLQADISDRGQVERAVHQLRSACGPITVLVNNAGVSAFAPFDEMNDHEWDQMLAINVKGTFIVTQAVLPDMKAQRWGRIVNITSSSAQSGNAHQAHYSASKGALISMTRSLALELGPLGITVNNIPPGAVLGTDMTDKLGQKYPVDAIKNFIPVRRTGVPEDVASACAWLVSEDAGYITGQTIGANGGRVVS